jgi:hypothetical protein
VPVVSASTAAAVSTHKGPSVSVGSGGARRHGRCSSGGQHTAAQAAAAAALIASLALPQAAGQASSSAESSSSKFASPSECGDSSHVCGPPLALSKAEQGLLNSSIDDDDLCKAVVAGGSAKGKKGKKK